MIAGVNVRHTTVTCIASSIHPRLYTMLMNRCQLRHLLGIKPDQTVVFERFSDSAGGYITLDPNNPQVFKTLVRAAKAKLKLRLKATVTPGDSVQEPAVKPEAVTVDPTIVRTPVYQPSTRDSTALDRRSVGSGIFQFREARASDQTLVSIDNAPVPGPFCTDRKDFFKDLTNLSKATLDHHWSVFCNECDKSMADAHYHCSICDGGDYDLCEDCVASGKLCPGEGHWLIRRYIKDGKVIASTTERISPRSKKLPSAVDPVTIADEKKEIPGAFADESNSVAEEVPVPTRTCNSCIVVLPEREFVTCTVCEDFDLCIACHTNNKHGHHPAHSFKPASDDTVLPLASESTLASGRNVRHNAICDGCDKNIYGVRHKCLNCPDWDFCNECVKTARVSHPRHRFAAIYEPIADCMTPTVRHFGIFCDGPLCKGKENTSHITGVRYKCAVCHDTDFCASCEAHPSNTHNRTHPLIKFKSPVRNVSITTENEDLNGHVRIMGDRRSEPVEKDASTAGTSLQQENVATEVQTIAEIKPADAKQESQPIPIIKSEEKRAVPIDIPGAATVVNMALLNAHFVHDTINDGMIMHPGARFTQIWTLKNPGPYNWPAGCSVRYIGGDNMLNVDNTHPAAVSDIANASESNVIGREVAIGEEIAFKVNLRAPMREGKSISYWRLKTADGTPFGHRLWCDIEIKAIPQPPVAALAAFNPFHATKEAQLHRMQFLRQRQLSAAQAQQAAMQRLAQAKLPQPVSPPTYESSECLRSRLSLIRADQQRLHEQRFAQYNSRCEAPQALNGEEGPSFPQYLSPISDISSHKQEDMARKEAARQRIEQCKAKVMKARADQRAKHVAAQKAAFTADQLNGEESKKANNADEEFTNGSETDVEKQKTVTEEKMEGSLMVFPKLEKESPASSTYQFTASGAVSKGRAAYVENENGEIERSATPAATAAPIPEPAASSPIEAAFDDLDDDIEVLSATAGDESEGDDGFLTDEEYDILDASDQETLVSH